MAALEGANVSELNLRILLRGTREEVIDRRDQIIDALKPLGLRLSLIDCGLDVDLVDEGVPTFSDLLVELAKNKEDKT